MNAEILIKKSDTLTNNYPGRLYKVRLMLKRKIIIQDKIVIVPQNLQKIEVL